MYLKFGFLGATALAAVFAVGVATASAATLKINSVSGVWTNLVANPAGGTISYDGQNKIRWGNPFQQPKQSGYDFTGAAPPALIKEEDEDFSLGEFTHLNFPITGTSLISADLLVEIVLDGYINPIISTFSFLHDETTNENKIKDCKYQPSVSRCDDLVKASLNLGKTESFNIGDIEYVFTISGFEVAGTTFSQFLTEEGKSNSANLIGKFVTKESVSPVPLPAAAWMLLAGIAGLGAVARKRRSA
jgi:hypothetical protein